MKLEYPDQWSRLVRSFTVLMLTCDIYNFNHVVEGVNPEVEQHLEMGKKLLAAGQLADALSHYHAAVDGDPDNYLTYYRRATVYLALGKSRSALPDLDKVVKLKPDFTAARMQRGNVLLKQGKLDEALLDFNEVINREPNNEEAIGKALKIGPIRENVALARQYLEYQDYESVIVALEEPIELCPWDTTLREMRAEAYEAMGELFKAISDIRPTAKLIPDNQQAFLRMSLLHYRMGEEEESLNQIRECLKLDPDHKRCHSHYKLVKKLAKQLKDAQDLKVHEQYDECVSKASNIIKTDPDSPQFVVRAKSYLCHCHSKLSNVDESLKFCSEVLQLDPQNIDAMADKAEAHIANEDYQAAIQELQAAQEIDENSRRIRELLQRAQKLEKQSKKRDYYKILGVKRNARKKDILKAYRRLAVKWHPDKHEEGPQKEKAQKIFIDLAAAKEVLTDPEKRQRFDAGEDPLDPEEQQGGHGHPFFHQGFNPFGGGGFSFKFNFN
ncbi:Dnaj homolog subfamily c member 3-like [Plakobranchus ocellatus]|uniref:Dnaj homolog subfamily c member 3-like n=1 Tax=Plakobranchus ocellatus TaxID=259542 RepID=A0AAV4CB74_9GAST|nr:Dnaj homolog subfamily c member 3-like [Plakobranchus ocellatus]